MTQKKSSKRHLIIKYLKDQMTVSEIAEALMVSKAYVYSVRYSLTKDTKITKGIRTSRKRKRKSGILKTDCKGRSYVIIQCTVCKVWEKNRTDRITFESNYTKEVIENYRCWRCKEEGKT